jgi:hypothetical protein
VIHADVRERLADDGLVVPGATGGQGQRDRHP